MTIVLRAAKGAPLTSPELDGNFTDLDGRVTDLEENPPAGVSVSSFSVDGRTFSVHMSNGATFGPYPLPSGAWVWAGTWTQGQTYPTLSFFMVPLQGLFLVVGEEYNAPADGTDPAVFDPEATDTEGFPVLEQILGYDDIVGSTGFRNYELHVASDTYTLGGNEENWWLLMDSGSDIDVDIPAAVDMAEGFDQGFFINFVQINEGPVRFDPAAGVTINGSAGFQYLKAHKGAHAMLVYRGSDAWDLVGDLKRTVAFEIVTRTAADYTINGREEDQYIRMDSTNPQSIFLPLEASTPDLLAGHHVTFRQANTGLVSVEEVDLATSIYSPGSLDSAGQGSVIHVLYLGNDEWDIWGDIDP